MKLNLGCGLNHLDGFVNVDRAAESNPDRIVDLEILPWPFETDSASEVVLNHVIEHLGADPRVFDNIIRELYRICRDGARVTIAVPHPRHDDHITDPGHVRAILPETFQLYSKALNRQWQARGVANSPLALYLDVDFEIDNINYILDPLWDRLRAEGTADDDDIRLAMRRENNVVKNVEIALRVVKP